MFLFLCVALLQGPAAAIPMKTIDAGTQSQIEERRQVTARSAEEWAALWPNTPGTAAPAVDFAHEMVAGVFSAAARPPVRDSNRGRPRGLARWWCNIGRRGRQASAHGTGHHVALSTCDASQAHGDVRLKK
jgi:hypothetical protein